MFQGQLSEMTLSHQEPHIEVPYRFYPRDYQTALFEAMRPGGKKRAVIVWHRRAGKEKTCLNFLIKEMLNRVGTYCYYFPTTSLGRRVLWDGCDGSGMRFLEHFPPCLIESQSNLEMKIRLKNGSLFQVIGTDQVLNVGINPVGVVFSEFSLQKPEGWAYIRPILRENKGWAIFNFTPRGRNHAFELYQMAKQDPDWFCQCLSIRDTKAFNEEDMEKERREGMNEELIQQEFYCSFDQGMEGSYYGRLIDQARQDGRITKVPVDSATLVHTAWDLGYGDSTAIIFYQIVGTAIHIVDYYENSGEGLTHYVQELKKRDYNYGSHHAPHDVEAGNLATGRSLKHLAAELGIKFQVVPRVDLFSGIEIARSTLSRCYFDERKAERVIKCLEMYHKKYNDKVKAYSDVPVHDWSSHCADAFRYLAIACRGQQKKGLTKEDIELLRWKSVGGPSYSPKLG